MAYRGISRAGLVYWNDPQNPLNVLSAAYTHKKKNDMRYLKYISKKLPQKT